MAVNKERDQDREISEHSNIRPTAIIKGDKEHICNMVYHLLIKAGMSGDAQEFKDRSIFLDLDDVKLLAKDYVIEG